MTLPRRRYPALHPFYFFAGGHSTAGASTVGSVHLPVRTGRWRWRRDCEEDRNRVAVHIPHHRYCFRPGTKAARRSEDAKRREGGKGDGYQPCIRTGSHAAPSRNHACKEGGAQHQHQKTLLQCDIRAFRSRRHRDAYRVLVCRLSPYCPFSCCLDPSRSCVLGPDIRIPRQRFDRHHDWETDPAGHHLRMREIGPCGDCEIYPRALG